MTPHDEAHESRPCVVLPIRPNRFAPQPRPCVNPDCDSSHFEVGELCEPCRLAQDPLPAAMIQSTIADGIARLERMKPSDTPEPLRLAVAMALADMRRAFDAVEPLVQEEQAGV